MIRYVSGVIQPPQNSNVINKRGGDVYSDIIFSFDTEVTSAFVVDGIPNAFDYTKPKEYYADIEKTSLVYIWQFGINDTVYYGRDIAELPEFLRELDEKIPYNKIIYVHNLAYDFQFLLNVLLFENVFARDSHKVMKCDVPAYHCTFKCSYFLTRLSLEKWADQKKLPVKKLKGDLDYNVMRTPKTEMTQQELEYCEHDILVMYHGIKQYVSQYGDITKIPLTQTGEVRKQVQNLYTHNPRYKKQMTNLIPRDFFAYKRLVEVFTGGYAHANRLYAGNVLRRSDGDGVTSRDIASSYPTVLISEKFPSTCFTLTEQHDKFMRNTDYSYYATFTFINIRAKLYNTYISSSKCSSLAGETLDNGRILKADELTIRTTNIDYSIIEKCYKWDSVKIGDMYISKNEYLDKDFIKLVLSYYAGKTQLKGIDEMYALYMINKQYINSLYGMEVTNNIRDTVSVENGIWSTHELTIDDVNNELAKMRSKWYKNVTAYQFGVWCTAYARRNLWSIISQIDADIVYCDTDSVKYVGNHDDVINIYNKQIIEKMRTMCNYYNLSYDMLSPADTKGILHTIGIFEFDGDYEEFITLGAKKYAYTDNAGKMYITVSGVNKKTGAQALKTIDDFNTDLIFNYETSGRSILHYNDEQNIVTWQPNEYDEYKSNYKFGITLQPTTYVLGITDDYAQVLKEAQAPTCKVLCS